MQTVKIRHLPNFWAMGQTVAKLWWFNSLEDGVRPPIVVPIGQTIADIWPFFDFFAILDLQKFELLTAGTIQSVSMRHRKGDLEKCFGCCYATPRSATQTVAELLFCVGRMMSLNTLRCRQLVPLIIWSLSILVSLRSSTALVTAALQSRQQQQRYRQHPGWTTTAAPRRRQPPPIDCFEGLRRCREDPACRTQLNTLDSVCDQSSTSSSSSLSSTTTTTTSPPPPPPHF